MKLKSGKKIPIREYMVIYLRLDDTLMCRFIYAQSPKQAAERCIGREVLKICCRDDFDRSLMESTDLFKHHDRAEYAVCLFNAIKSKYHYYKPYRDWV